MSIGLGFRHAFEAKLNSLGELILVHKNWGTPEVSTTEYKGYKKENKFQFPERIDISEGDILQQKESVDFWYVVDVNDEVKSGSFICFQTTAERLSRDGSELRHYRYGQANYNNVLSHDWKRILRAVDDGQAKTASALAKCLDLSIHVVLHHLDAMKAEDLIKFARYYSSDLEGKHEYCSFVLTSKGKVAIESPEKLNRTTNSFLHTLHDHRTYNTNNINNSNLGALSQEGNTTMSGNRTINTGGGKYHEGDIGHINLHDQSSYAEGDYYNNPAQKQTLAEAAAEIQQLLDQLSQTYPTDTTTGKMAVATAAIEQIDRNPNLTARILSALKAGSIEALAQALNHPAASFVIGALEDWQKSKGN